MDLTPDNIQYTRNSYKSHVSQAIQGNSYIAPLVASVDLQGSLGLLPLGYVGAEWLSDHLGPPSVFLWGACKW
jgi:hypothetical protein